MTIFDKVIPLGDTNYAKHWLVIVMKLQTMELLFLTGSSNHHMYLAPHGSLGPQEFVSAHRWAPTDTAKDGTAVAGPASYLKLIWLGCSSSFL